jgi:hypothetical protein
MRLLAAWLAQLSAYMRKNRSARTTAEVHTLTARATLLAQTVVRRETTLRGAATASTPSAAATPEETPALGASGAEERGGSEQGHSAGTGTGAGAETGAMSDGDGGMEGSGVRNVRGESAAAAVLVLGVALELGPQRGGPQRVAGACRDVLALLHGARGRRTLLGDLGRDGAVDLLRGLVALATHAAPTDAALLAAELVALPPAPLPPRGSAQGAEGGEGSPMARTGVVTRARALAMVAWACEAIGRVGAVNERGFAAAAAQQSAWIEAVLSGVQKDGNLRGESEEGASERAEAPDLRVAALYAASGLLRSSVGVAAGAKAAVLPRHGRAIQAALCGAVLAAARGWRSREEGRDPVRGAEALKPEPNALGPEGSGSGDSGGGEGGEGERQAGRELGSEEREGLLAVVGCHAALLAGGGADARDTLLWGATRLLCRARARSPAAFRVRRRSCGSHRGFWCADAGRVRRRRDGGSAELAACGAGREWRGGRRVQGRARRSPRERGVGTDGAPPRAPACRMRERLARSRARGTRE